MVPMSDPFILPATAAADAMAKQDYFAIGGFLKKTSKGFLWFSEKWSVRPLLHGAGTLGQGAILHCILRGPSADCFATCPDSGAARRPDACAYQIVVRQHGSRERQQSPLCLFRGFPFSAAIRACPWMCRTYRVNSTRMRICFPGGQVSRRSCPTASRLVGGFSWTLSSCGFDAKQ